MIDRRALLAAAAAGFGTISLPRITLADSGVDLKPDLAQQFRDASTEGTFAALNLKSGHLIMTDETRARMGMIPASTFKIPHAVIALETGVVADTDKEVIRWDGIDHHIPEWNQDHTLRSAMAVSAVPVFQQIAHRIGSERMKTFLDALNYGNRDISGAPIDRFWLDGNLRISAFEQVRFLERFYKNDLPVAPRSIDLVKDILTVDKLEEGATIHFKTGTVGTKTQQGWKATLGWLVGYAVRGEDVTLFALNLDVHGQPQLARRLPIARMLLKQLGAV